MKKSIIVSFVAALLLSVSFRAAAQEVNTTTLLLDAPYRHYYNPAYQPTSGGYFYLPALSHIDLQLGNNSFTMADWVFSQNGKTYLTLHPLSTINPMDAVKRNTLVKANGDISLLGFGFRIKEKGYMHILLDQHIDAGVGIPRDLFRIVLGGGMTNATGNNHFDLTGLGASAQVYTSVGIGYSHQTNEQFSWGFKVKFLVGQAYANLRSKQMDFDASIDQWSLNGNGYLRAALPLTLTNLPEHLDGSNLNEDTFSDITEGIQTDNLIRDLLRPAGFGGALDFGITYSPIKELTLSLALTDVGAIYWRNAYQYNYTVNGVYDGVGELKYEDYVNDEGQFDASILGDTIVNRLDPIWRNALSADLEQKGFLAAINGRLHAGIEANLFNNILGLGLTSNTLLYNANLYEELTFGVAFRPASWVNLAASYSFLNGRWNNIGAGLTLRGGPFVLTVAADYVPLTYATISPDEKAYIPYKTPGLNVETGLAIVWDWDKNNRWRRDKDKDGVKDKLDMCPNTPKDVAVDCLGCPMDSDDDGVPDYLDECPNTPVAAFGYLDEHGCPVDTDGDGVPDYLDNCPKTPQAAFAHLSTDGCPLDSDQDGVPDYLDLCNDTPEDGRAHVDEHGCLPDSDNDGVPDYRDRCPNTPAEAIGHTDENGCLLDSDGDGIPDYQDSCPQVAGPQSNHGCPEIQREVRNLLTRAMQGIQFETGKAVIKRQSYAILDQIAQVFTEHPDYVIEVQGHTDNVGKADYNLRLSQARAEAVRDYLINKGISEKRLTAVGYGDTKPMDTNETAAGRAQNRRVEFIINFEEITYETIQLTQEDIEKEAKVVDSIH